MGAVAQSGWPNTGCSFSKPDSLDLIGRKAFGVPVVQLGRARTLVRGF